VIVAALVGIAFYQSHRDHQTSLIFHVVLAAVVVAEAALGLKRTARVLIASDLAVMVLMMLPGWY
jgi:hypothetical protein